VYTYIYSVLHLDINEIGLINLFWW